MYAQAGEVADSWVEEDKKEIEKILNANGKRREKYWILLFEQVIPHKKIHFCGARPITRTIKVYAVKPPPLVGCLIGEVNNQTGELTWEIYPKDIPYTWDLLKDAAKPEIHKCKIPGAYIYNEA
jgi:hypothetical protein